MTTTARNGREATLAFLDEHQAGVMPHLFGDLLTHLLGTESLVRAWGGSELLALAALGHAAYGTDGFEDHFLSTEDRPALAAVIGNEAEALVYFYASCDRDDFYPQLEAGAGSSELSFRDRFTGDRFSPARGLVTQFVDLTYANEGELAASSPGGAAEWTWLAEFRRGTQHWATPGFAAGLGALLGSDR
jgi:hypothetical protein